jgi:chromosome segregation ATPase
MQTDLRPVSTPATNTAAPAKPDTAATNPEDDLKAKQSALKQAQDEIAKQTQAANSLQSDIRALQAKIADVQQALAGYDAFSRSMGDRLKVINNLISQKIGIAEVATKDTKGQIDQKIAEFDKALAAQGDKVNEDSSAYEAAAAAVDSDRAISQEKQALYEAKKKTSQDLENRIKELSGLLDQAGAAETKGDYVALYVLANEAKALAGTIQIPSADDYAAALKTAQEGAEQAKLGLIDKQARAGDLMTALTAARQAYDGARASRRTDLLNALKTLKPKSA